MKKYVIAYLAFFTVMTITMPALAGSRDECISKCKEASEYVQNHGIDAAVKEISNKNGLFVWNKGISYVFLMNLKGKMLAHPHDPNLAKRDTLIDLVDTDGKPFVKECYGPPKKEKDGQNITGRCRGWMSSSPSIPLFTVFPIPTILWVLEFISWDPVYITDPLNPTSACTT